jgi:hypothetical protein
MSSDISMSRALANRSSQIFQGSTQRTVTTACALGPTFGGLPIRFFTASAIAHVSRSVDTSVSIDDLPSRFNLGTIRVIVLTGSRVIVYTESEGKGQGISGRNPEIPLDGVTPTGKAGSTVSTLAEIKAPVNVDPTMVATFESAEWIEAQASYYRSLGSDLAELVADTLEELGMTWRVVSQGNPIAVETFRGRCEILQEWRDEVDSIDWRC